MSDSKITYADVAAVVPTSTEGTRPVQVVQAVRNSENGSVNGSEHAAGSEHGDAASAAAASPVGPAPKTRGMSKVFVHNGGFTNKPKPLHPSVGGRSAGAAAGEARSAAAGEAASLARGTERGEHRAAGEARSAAAGGARAAGEHRGTNAAWAARPPETMYCTECVTPWDVLKCTATYQPPRVKNADGTEYRPAPERMKHDSTLLVVPYLVKSEETMYQVPLSYVQPCKALRLFAEILSRSWTVEPKPYTVQLCTHGDECTRFRSCMPCDFLHIAKPVAPVVRSVSVRGMVIQLMWLDDEYTVVKDSKTTYVPDPTSSAQRDVWLRARCAGIISAGASCIIPVAQVPKDIAPPSGGTQLSIKRVK